MLDTKIISIKELAKFGSVENLNDQALSLVEQQKDTWKTLAANYETLNQSQTRTFKFDHFRITAQFNAERIRSSAAKTDAKSIAGRPCFLCLKNLPAEQKGILFQKKYLILTNPYPIFQKHLTISGLEHVPQEILSHFAGLLDLSENLPGFTFFYNGPQCGASAPDHFHFQAVTKRKLPVETELEMLKKEYSELLFENEKLKVIAAENYLRRIVVIISEDKNETVEMFEKIYQILVTNNMEEPMMNIICNFENGKWRVMIFPREKQRPSHFFRTDEKQIVVSPAAVEMGGILVLPRENDFKKITKTEIAEIYNEVTIDSEKFKNLIHSINRL